MNKQLIIIRGAQGSGKSSTAAIWAAGDKNRWYETDQYWSDMNGHYDFDPRRIHIAHDWCYDMVEAALENPDVERVVVSNCFATKEQMMPYIMAADRLKIPYRILLKFEKYPNEHGVPDDVVQRVREKMEPVVGEYICASCRADMDRLVETYPKYRDVYVDLPKGDGFDGLPRVIPAPGEPGFSEYAYGRDPADGDEDVEENKEETT